ncbi:MAG: prepilin-type N-terminal cleavage/methylation domain-containing protein [Planctomycetaceae bacterium]
MTSTTGRLRPLHNSETACGVCICECPFMTLNPQPSTLNRHGFTLLEVLLVLSVMAVIIGITWPSVTRYMGEAAIRDSALAAQTAVLGTRIKAIDTGLTYQFRYEPGGQRFTVIPFDPPENIDATTSVDSTSPQLQIYPVLSGRIDESCQFTSTDERLFTATVVESLPREAFANLIDAHELETTAWAPPLLFFADGTSSDATFRIKDEVGARSRSRYED